ncbi:pentatricopeptide repeat-containing protein [Iris pallida]|uniref:Pentatricopeptide repeat-containing protein n=1 Tax=Iris pallida TaxID=29817 RepID=A0AAX6HUM1_IRIPA|nr:pentatricopeptide repeat-containing protein [Iris pallida]
MLAPPPPPLQFPLPRPQQHGNLPKRSNKSKTIPPSKEQPILHFRRLLSDGLPNLNTFTFSSLFKSCADLSAAEQARQLHAQAAKRGFLSDVFVRRSLVRMYSNFAPPHLDAMRSLYRSSEPDTVSLNDLIIGFARAGDTDTALKVFDGMPERNVVSWSALVDGYARNGRMRLAQRLFDSMPERNDFAWTSLLTGYSGCGRMATARKVFDRREGKRNVAAWTAMVSGYVRNGEWTKALEVFVEMQVAGLKPNAVTVLSVLPAVSQLGALGQGRWIHSYVDRTGMEVDSILGSALVDMYSKCGCIDDAIAVFETLKRKELSAWNSIILGLAAHGRGSDALGFFSRMRRDVSMVPNDITFVAVLSACSHCGLVEVGWEMFRLFTRHYKLIPNARHYGCMVDLLGRAGFLEDALQFVENMPVEPSLVIWKTLLSACKVRMDVEMADRVLGRMSRLEARDSGFYGLVSNIFRDSGRWDDASRARREMNDSGVRKVAGCSWVEVDGVVCEFLMGKESFHNRSQEIASVLYEMERLMTLEDYDERLAEP